MFLARPGTPDVEVPLDQVGRVLSELSTEHWLNLVLGRAIPKDAAVAEGERIAATIAELFNTLLPVYENSDVSPTVRQIQCLPAASPRHGRRSSRRRDHLLGQPRRRTSKRRWLRIGFEPGLGTTAAAVGHTRLEATAVAVFLFIAAANASID